MKFRILKSEFLLALNAIQGVVDKKNIMPILANVLVKAKAGEPTIQLLATDLEVAVHVNALAQIEEAGEITVCAKSLFEIVRESSGQDVVVNSTENERVEVFSSQSQYKILGLSAKEFPSLPVVDGNCVRVAGDDLAKIFSKVSFAMSTDETRHHLNGVLLEKSACEIVAVATDGHRLAHARQPINLEKVNFQRAILPRKGVGELQKLVAAEKFVDVSASSNHVLVKTEKQALFLRLIDGNFPDYHRVIPTENPVLISLPREEFLGALKRVSILANDRSKGVLLYFCNNSLTITSSNPEVGDAKEDINLEYKGPVLNIGFNARYFIDVLSVLSDDKINISFKDGLSPCLVQSPSDASFKAVVMPMRM